MKERKEEREMRNMATPSCIYPQLLEKDFYRVHRIGLPLLPDKVANTREELLEMYGLDDHSICKKIKDIVLKYG